MKKNEILYICRKQFGYSIDNYYHCKYLKNSYLITYFSPDVGWEKIKMQGIDTIYVRFNKNRIYNNIRFYIKAIQMIHKSNYKLVILNRSYFFFLFKVFHPLKTFIYDIRSGIVKPIAWKRKLFTFFLKWDILFFKNITIISDSLAKKLKIKRYQVLPLGAEAFNLPPKKFNEIQLMYVGTFNNRRIEETIVGFSLFLQKVPENNISYHIYGFGTPDAEEKITSSIDNLHLENRIFFHGKITPTDLRDKLRIHNLGVSYIPITPYFDVQPPTKTFEYLLAGMPVIATNTSENARVITEENGVLIPDSPEGFKTGLEAIYSKIIQNHYSSDIICHNSRFFSWDYIVSNIFKPYIDDLITN